MKDPALNPVHPGEILLEDFLKPLSISPCRLAKDIHVPLRRVNEIALQPRGISADTASRLAHDWMGRRVVREGGDVTLRCNRVAGLVVLPHCAAVHDASSVPLLDFAFVNLETEKLFLAACPILWALFH